MNKQRLWARPLICLSICLGTMSCIPKNDHAQTIENCIADLNDILHAEQGWIKVHAAEYLLWTGNGDAVKPVFLEEEKKYGHSIPYRIGIWRVLAQTASDSTERTYWITKIANAFLDEQGPDRIHAVESMAKLQISPLSFSKTITEKAVSSKDENLSTYTKWSMAYYAAANYKQTQQALLDNILHRQEYNLSPAQIRIMAFALKQMLQLGIRDSETMAQSALHEKDTSAVKQDLLALAYSVSTFDVTAPLAVALYESLIRHYKTGGTREKILILRALADNKIHNHTGQLLDFYHREKQPGDAGYNPDVHAAATYALLKSINTNK